MGDSSTTLVLELLYTVNVVVITQLYVFVKTHRIVP